MAVCLSSDFCFLFGFAAICAYIGLKSPLFKPILADFAVEGGSSECLRTFPGSSITKPSSPPWV